MNLLHTINMMSLHEMVWSDIIEFIVNEGWGLLVAARLAFAAKGPLSVHGGIAFRRNDTMAAGPTRGRGSRLEEAFGWELAGLL